jgi:hypothetical protein
VRTTIDSDEIQRPAALQIDKSDRPCRTFSLQKLFILSFRRETHMCAYHAMFLKIVRHFR